MIQSVFITVLLTVSLIFSGHCSEILSLEELAKQPVYNFESNDFSRGRENLLQLDSIENKDQVYRMVYFDYGYDVNIPFSPSDFPNLQDLTIYSCYSHFPEEITGFKKLQVITLKPFNLGDICSEGIEVRLPPTFFGLKHLKIVDFRNNSITYIPEEINELKELRIFMSRAPYEYSEYGEESKQFSKKEQQVNEWYWYMGRIEYYPNYELRSLPVSILSLDKLAVFAIDRSEKLPEWNIFKQQKRNVLFAGNFFDLPESIWWKADNLLNWYVESIIERSDINTISDGQYTWTKDSLEIIGSYGNHEPIGKWEFRINDTLRQMREFYGDSITFSIFDSNELLINTWTINESNISGTRITRYEDGSVYHKEYFSNGKLIGTAKMYYPDGKLKATVEQNATGSTSKMYRPNGKVTQFLKTEKINDHNYFAIEYYHEHGEADNVKISGYLLNGVYVDSLDVPIPIKHYDSNGHLIESIIFDARGNKYERTTYEYQRGITVKRMLQRFHTNGQLAIEEFHCVDLTRIYYSHNLIRDGIWRTWDYNGRLTSKTEYNMGIELE